MRNKILKAITAVAVILLIIGISCMDSENMYVPAGLCAGAMVWLVPFMIANWGLGDD